MDVLCTILKNRHRIDLLLVEVYSGLSFVIADLAGGMAKISGIPAVFVLHGGKLPEHASRYPRWTKRVLGRSRIVAAPSRFLASEMRRKGLAVRVIPNVLSEFPNVPGSDKNLQPKLLWMRSFHSIYDPSTAVKVFSLVKRNYPEATLVMAGSDKGLEKATKQYAADLNLSDSVSFPGFLDAAGKAREFANADIYLNTNIIDNSPVSVIEAWSYGLPVVTTDVGGIPYMVDDGVNGLLAKSGDAEDMAAKVTTLLEHPALRRSLARNGRETAKRSTWDSVRPLWERIFEEMQSKPETAPIRQPA